MLLHRRIPQNIITIREMCIIKIFLFFFLIGELPYRAENTTLNMEDNRKNSFTRKNKLLTAITITYGPTSPVAYGHPNDAYTKPCY